MTSRTKSLARSVHTALMTLDPPTLFTLIETALTELPPEDIEMADNLRFRLGWVLQDDQGHQHTTWPNDTPQSVDWVEWVDPDPNTLAHTLAHTDVITFYHEILPVFATYPSLDAMPPSVASDGYRWMQALASWIRSYPDNLREAICPADSPRMTTADIAAGLPLPVGDCGDA